ncbi:P-loop containing nucleoside triphosphate hydrolase protein [Dunaliella salina]|uniref:P-loop containing nucleoside triphosphate hydrolase protein n=1 Tax=Dunaliella salina TaxID=3046 RepID=A0ABQ7H4A5_DUNSA|nr:P-loop containing nucleoside triphosphate hydrolase protein [Dunaliella salina]|eukprot:KAF5841692.1 P-loop containing nucleoside triphosphate hydrolase protein [Dunaliella salina]
MLHATGRLCLQGFNRLHLLKSPIHASCWGHRTSVNRLRPSVSTFSPLSSLQDKFDMKVPDEVAPDIILRDYQKQTVEDVLDNLKNGLMRQLLALPTGSGKTVIFLTIARLLNLKTLIITNSVELIAQTHQKLTDIWPGVWYSVIQNARSPVDRQVVIATVQAASRPKQLEKLHNEDFQLLIVDEAHHSTANSYVTIMLNLGFLSLQDAALISGKHWYKVDPKDSSSTDSESDEDSEPLFPRSPATHGLWRLETKKDAKDRMDKNRISSTAGSADSESAHEGISDSIRLESSCRSSTQSDNGNSTLKAIGDSNGTASNNFVIDHFKNLMEDMSLSTDSEAEANNVEHVSMGQPIVNDYHSNGTSSSSPDSSPSGKIILGCTATPYRRGPDKLRTIFDTLVQVVTIGDLIRRGYLCKVYAERILTYTDISQAVAPDGSLPDAELSKAVDTPERNHLVVSAYLARAADRKAVAFCCTLEHASNLAEAFRERGISSEPVHSKLSKAARLQLLDDHQRGEIQVLTNVGILTEGYDDTSISCVLMTKPTTSTGLYTQCVGRGLRPHPGKEDCILLDFTDRLHSLDKESDLVTGEDVFKNEKGVTLRNYDPDARDVIALELRNIMGGQFDIYAQQGFFWVQHFHDYWMSLMPESANPFKRKTEQGPKGSVWIHLREVEPPLSPGVAESARHRDAPPAHHVRSRKGKPATRFGLCGSLQSQQGASLQCHQHHQKDFMRT